MCLSIPGKVVKKSRQGYIIDYGKEKREIKQSIVDVEVGDYVIVSNKMIISKVNKEKAKEFLEVLE